MSTVQSGNAVEDTIRFRVPRQKHSTACDFCRRRKVLCDASERSDNRCSRCTTYGIQCQWESPPKIPTRAYVQALEKRIKCVEDLIERVKFVTSQPSPQDLNSDSDLSRHHASSSSSAFPPTPSRSSPLALVRVPPLHSLTEPDLDELNPSEDESEMALGSSIGYIGKSSNKNIVLAIMGLKNNGTSMARGYRVINPQSRPTLHPVDFDLPIVINSDRLPPHNDFPQEDLLNTLVDAYFRHHNIYLPLLHQPSFQDDIRLGLHLRDRRFGTVVLLACAIGCTWTKDPRIPPEPAGRAPGFTWFDKIIAERWSTLARPRLFDVQACALMAAFLNFGHAPQSSWSLLSLGIRMAQDVGAHRRRMYDAQPTPEQELWRRAFWVLIAMDRITSFALGRPCAVHDEDFDLGPITECDDEYWYNPDPTLAFKQPQDKPSKIAFANYFSRLLKILAFASRTIYTINKSKLLLGFVGTEWRQSIVAELDSALNRWVESLPDHLRWDPNREDLVFFRQTAVLHTCYHEVQICVHRQFASSFRQAALTPSLPSLAICTSAARSIVGIMEAQLRRLGKTFLLPPMHSHFTACVIIMLAMWGRHPCSDRERELLVSDLARVLATLEAEQKSNYASRKLRAVLRALMGTQLSGPTAIPRNLGDFVTTALDHFEVSLEEDAPEDFKPPTRPSGTSDSSASRLPAPFSGFPPWNNPTLDDLISQRRSALTTTAPTSSQSASNDNDADTAAHTPAPYASLYDPEVTMGYEDLFSSLTEIFGDTGADMPGQESETIPSWADSQPPASNGFPVADFDFSFSQYFTDNGPTGPDPAQWMMPTSDATAAATPPYDSSELDRFLEHMTAPTSTGLP